MKILSNIELYWKVIWNIIFYTSVNIIYKEVSGNSFIKGKLFEYNFIMKIFGSLFYAVWGNHLRFLLFIENSLRNHFIWGNHWEFILYKKIIYR